MPESKEDRLESPPAALLLLLRAYSTPEAVVLGGCTTSSTLTVSGCCTDGDAARKALVIDAGDEVRSLNLVAALAAACPAAAAAGCGVKGGFTGEVEGGAPMPMVQEEEEALRRGAFEPCPEVEEEDDEDPPKPK